jgi:hypothetical protein
LEREISLSLERGIETLSFERGKETFSFEREISLSFARGRFNETSLSLKKYANSPMKEVEIFH